MNPIEKDKLLKLLRQVEYCVPDRFDPKEKERDKCCPMCGFKRGHDTRRGCELSDTIKLIGGNNDVY